MSKLYVVKVSDEQEQNFKVIRKHEWRDDKDCPPIIGLALALDNNMLSHKRSPIMIRKGEILPIVSFDMEGIWIWIAGDDSYFAHYGKEWNIKFDTDIFGYELYEGG